MLAANNGERLESLILAAAGVQLSSPFVPGKPFYFLVPVPGLFMKKWGFPPNPSDCSNFHYPRAPSRALVSAPDLYRASRAQLSTIRSPALLIQGRKYDTLAQCPENQATVEISGIVCSRCDGEISAITTMFVIIANRIPIGYTNPAGA